MCGMNRRYGKSVRVALAVGGMIAIACIQTGCQACWTVNDSACGSTSWGGSGVEFNGCGDGDAALFIGALYLALLVPYLIAEAYRECGG